MIAMRGVLVRGLVHGATGLLVQVLAAGLVLWLTRGPLQGPAAHALPIALLGIPIWLHIIATYAFLAGEAACISPSASRGEDGARPRSKRDRVAAAHRVYQNVGTRILELVAVVLLVRGSWLWFKPVDASAEGAGDVLLLVALLSVAALGAVVFCAYILSLARVPAWGTLKAGASHALLLCAALIALLTAACLRHFGADEWAAFSGTALAALNTVLAAETICFAIARFFAPRKAGSLPRPAFDFYLVDLLARPHRVGDTVRDMLTGIFGFDVSRTSFGRLLSGLLLPALLVSPAVLLLLSSLVSVGAHEQAVLLRFGRLHPAPLGPGLHITWPWPISRVDFVNVGEVRGFHVGSHRPRDGSGPVYRPGVPILWANAHGFTVDELLICASPRDMGRTDEERPAPPESGEAPSISLTAADVFVQYVVHDAVAFTRTMADVERFLRAAAEQRASLLIYRHDIDALFCEARLPLAEDLRHTLQQLCDGRGLGVTILHTAVSAVHPPPEIGDAFEEPVAAQQERETLIQEALKDALHVQVETAGSRAEFERLAAAVDAGERPASDAITNDVSDVGGSADPAAVLARAGGRVAELLAEAHAYRFSRQSREEGKAERFAAHRQVHDAAPENYRHDRYLSVLEAGLADRRKVMLMKDDENVIVRMGLGSKAGAARAPPPASFLKNR